MYTRNPLMGTLANSDDPDEMQHNAASHQGMQCLLILKQSSGTEIQHNLEKSICGPLKYTMGSPILIVSKCMRKSIRMQKVKRFIVHIKESQVRFSKKGVPEDCFYLSKMCRSWYFIWVYTTSQSTFLGGSSIKHRVS